MAYSREQIIQMRDDGELTKLQAREMLSKLRGQAEPKEAPDPMKALADELRGLAKSVETSVTGQANVAAAIGRMIRILAVTHKMLEMDRTVKIEMPETEARPKKLLVTGERDGRGLMDLKKGIQIEVVG